MTPIEMAQRIARIMDAAEGRLTPAYVPPPIEPLPHQKAFVEDRTQITVARGGNRSGKSHAGAMKVASIVRRPPPWPGCPFWIVGQTYEMACEIGWGEKLSKFICEPEISWTTYFDKKRGWPCAIGLKNGWRLEFKSAEQGRGSFQGRSIGGAWIDEQFPPAIFVEIFARTSKSRGQIILTQTPVEPDPFLEDKYNAQPKGWAWHKFHTRDNSTLSGEWMDDFEREIPEQFRGIRLHGDFGSFDGAIYSEFARSTHVVEDLPDNMRVGHEVIRSIDFGFNNPFVCLWIMVGGDGDYTVFDEYYRPRGLMAEHAEEILRISRGMSISHTYADPEDAQARGELTARGIPTEGARKDVRAGIECVKSLLSCTPGSRPRIRIAARCANTIREMQNYRWEKATTRTSPDVPMKMDDHTCDALRYAILSNVSRKRQITAPPRIPSVFAGAFAS